MALGDTDETASDQPGPGAPLDAEALRAALRGLALGDPLIYLPAVGSTNTLAAELALGGAAEGTLITTDHQTAGRGRVGRVWKALPNQQLALSLILRPTFPPHYLVMASALAVAESIEAITAISPGAPDAPDATRAGEEGAPPVAIKWPNDVLVGGRKVCGILIEVSGGVAVLGMGVNVNGALEDDPELAARATTLEQAFGRPLSREALLTEIARRLAARYTALTLGGAEAQAALRAAWRARLITLGRRATVRQRDHTLEGLAEDVDGDGALLLRLDSGDGATITWGDVE